MRRHGKIPWPRCPECGTKVRVEMKTYCPECGWEFTISEENRKAIEEMREHIREQE